jgi:hypothetical protein
MFDAHTIVLERPRFDTPRAWFRARCSCGWQPMASYTRDHQEDASRQHLRGIRDDALKADLLAAYDRGEKVDAVKWYAARPLPEPLMAEAA